MKRELREDLKFGDENLAQAIQEHSAIFSYWGKRFVKACKKRDILKAQMEVMHATRARYYRKKNKGERITDSQIRSLVETDKKYLKSINKFLDAKASAEKLGVAKDALKQKKDMIEAFLRLMLSDMYSDVRMPREGKEALGRSAFSKVKGMSSPIGKRG